MTLLPYFYGTRSHENGASGDGFRTKILQGEDISSTGENESDGGVFSAELKPPKSISGESQQLKPRLIADVARTGFALKAKGKNTP